MPTVVPSLFVKAFDASFAEITDWRRAQFGPSSSGTVSAILMLFDSIPDRYFATLSDSDFAALTMAIGHTRDAVERWRRTDVATQRLTGGPFLSAPNLPGARHPLEVIRSALSKCDDTAPATTAHGLAFLGDPSFATALRLDMTSAESALGNAEYKPASVMAGAVIEALLIWALKRKHATHLDAALAAWQSAARAAGDSFPEKLPKAWEQWKLWHLINVARRIVPIPILSPEAADAANSAREFRNLIHPERANETRPTRGTAQIAVGAMVRVVEELEALVNDGKL